MGRRGRRPRDAIAGRRDASKNIVSVLMWERSVVSTVSVAIVRMQSEIKEMDFNSLGNVDIYIRRHFCLIVLF